MIDHSRIESGFDFEVLLGSEFFRMAVHALFDSGDLEVANEVEGLNLTVVIARPRAVEIAFDSFPLRRDPTNRSDDAVEMIDADLVMSMPFRFDVPGVASNEQELDLLLKVQIAEHLDAVTQLVNQIDLEVSYAGISQASWDWLFETFTVIGAALIDGVLREQIHLNLAEQLIPEGIQQVAIRKLAPAEGFQACYAMYLNLDLKRGPTHELVNVGPYGTPWRQPLPPEEAVLPVEGCDPQLGLNFLPSDRDVAFACPKAIYERLTIDQLHAFSVKNEQGIWIRPLMKRDKIMGAVRDISIAPASDSRIRIGVYVTVEGEKAEVDIYVKPLIGEDGELTMEFDVREPDTDVDFYDAAIIFAGALLTIGLAPITGGLSLAAGGILSGISLTMLHSVKEIYEAKGQKTVTGLIHNRRDSLLSFLAILPGRVSISEPRIDPFFNRHAQVVTQFKEVNIQKDGMSFAGTVTTGFEDRPVRDIQLIGRTREEEPIGLLRELLYQVPQPEKILQPNSFNRPESSDPREFLLNVEDAVERIKSNQLRKSTLLWPERVRLQDGRITEIYFDSGVALAPHEAGELQMKQVLAVVGFDLIRPRGRRPYYRSKPDVFTHNNLSSLPVYSSAPAVAIANQFAGFNQEVISFSSEQVAKWWNWYPDDGSPSMGLVAYYALSTYPLIKDLVWAHLGFEPGPEISWDVLDTAAHDPDWIEGQRPRLNPSSLSPDHSKPLCDWIANLSIRDLEHVAHSDLFDEELSTRRLLEKLLGYLYSRLYYMHRIKEQYLERHVPTTP